MSVVSWVAWYCKTLSVRMPFIFSVTNKNMSLNAENIDASYQYHILTTRICSWPFTRQPEAVYSVMQWRMHVWSGSNSQFLKPFGRMFDQIHYRRLLLVKFKTTKWICIWDGEMWGQQSMWVLQYL